MRKGLLALPAAALLAMPASASIPPVGWQGPKWTGPGLLCRPSFTFRLKKGEQAEQQYPSVGFIRFTIRSEAGVFEVAEDWYRRSHEERRRLRRTRDGLVYRLAGRGDGRTYLFVPRDGNLPFQLRFDPLSGRPPSFTGKAERSVIERLSFAQAGREGCLPEEPAAPKQSAG